MMLRETSLRLAGAAALLFAAATPALAAGDPPQQAQSAGAPSDKASDTAAAPAEAAKPQPKTERKICRMVNGSESRLAAQKVCMTAEQWKQTDY